MKWGLTNHHSYGIIQTDKTREDKSMAKKKKELDRRVFKKEGEELQQWLNFRKRGSKVENGKRYNRQKFKKGE